MRLENRTRKIDASKCEDSCDQRLKEYVPEMWQCVNLDDERDEKYNIMCGIDGGRRWGKPRGYHNIVYLICKKTNNTTTDRKKEKK